MASFNPTPDMGSSTPVLGKRKRAGVDRYDPSAADSVVISADINSSAPTSVDAAKRSLKAASDRADFNAQPTLRLTADDVCLIETAKMNQRSRCEVWNYAYLTNAYLGGKSRKIKSNKSGHRQQQDFCNAVRSANREMFDGLNTGKRAMDKLFSVVGHVPDQAISGSRHARQASINEDGMFQVPGWLPMSNSANSLVANLAKQTDRYVREIWVNGIRPNCLIPLNQY